nr:GNAT family N-acetyltransferase [Kibdelosporangium sp. MJ126-NF4]CEL13827.1 hypothetical protein [Kibdelosporangium sp. MJ126-NF4]CTQ88195.1 hypothetical protein [Kibdelosporangium sp. MJ126-NF4]
MEIRRIHQSEGGAVAELWDRMCREVQDGGPLTEHGRENITLMLAASTWHRDTFCLVAVDDQRIVGFVNGTATIGDGLLPGVTGEIDSLYVLPERRGEGTSTALARAAITWLREHGAHTIRYLSCADTHRDHRFWQGLGFESDMVCLSLYGDA